MKEHFLPPSDSPEQSKEILKAATHRGSFWETLKSLRLPVLSVALVGCAAPIGAVAEKSPHSSQQPTQESQANAGSKDGLSSLLDQMLYPDVSWKFTDAEKQEILSSPLATVIRGLTDKFTPKQIDSILGQLPQIYRQINTPEGKKLEPVFGADILRDFSRGNLSVSVELPQAKELESRGLTADMLTKPIYEEAGGEWNVRYGRIPVATEDKKMAQLRYTYVPVDSVGDFNTMVNNKPEVYSPRHSTLIGDYFDSTDRDIALPAIDPHKQYWSSSGFLDEPKGIPGNVLQRQYLREQGKNAQYLFLRSVFGGHDSADKFDIGYGAVQTFVFPATDETRKSPGATVVHGSDGVDYVVASRNGEIQTDPSNLLFKGLMAVVSQERFDEKK